MNEKQAKAAAANLAKRLGDGFEPYVHENLGWHYHARKGMIRIYEDIVRNPEHEGFPAYYSARIDSGGAVRFSGNSMGLGVQVAARGQTPKEALENVLRKRDEDCALLEEIIETLRKVA